MAAAERPRSEEIRALIEEVDRVRSESERVRAQLDDSMKRPFWPDRRRSTRIPPPSKPSDRDDAA